MEQQFIEWYSDLYLVAPDEGSAVVRLLKEAYECGYKQRGREEQENGRLLEGLSQ